MATTVMNKIARASGRILHRDGRRAPRPASSRLQAQVRRAGLYASFIVVLLIQSAMGTSVEQPQSATDRATQWQQRFITHYRDAFIIWLRHDGRVV